MTDTARRIRETAQAMREWKEAVERTDVHGKPMPATTAIEQCAQRVERLAEEFEDGTNYFWVEYQKCPHCGGNVDTEEYHIGKNSCGWAFALHAQEQVFSAITFEEWLHRMVHHEGYIEDEYGNSMALSDLVRVVLKGLDNPGALRRAPHRCHVAGGDEPYDVITGEFS